MPQLVGIIFILCIPFAIYQSFCDKKNDYLNSNFQYLELTSILENKETILLGNNKPDNIIIIENFNKVSKTFDGRYIDHETIKDCIIEGKIDENKLFIQEKMHKYYDEKEDHIANLHFYFGGNVKDEIRGNFKNNKNHSGVVNIYLKKSHEKIYNKMLHLLKNNKCIIFSTKNNKIKKQLNLEILNFDIKNKKIVSNLNFGSNNYSNLQGYINTKEIMLWSDFQNTTKNEFGENVLSTYIVSLKLDVSYRGDRVNGEFKVQNKDRMWDRWEENVILDPP